jgi:hypothetical protein
MGHDVLTPRQRPRSSYLLRTLCAYYGAVGGFGSAAGQPRLHPGGGQRDHAERDFRTKAEIFTAIVVPEFQAMNDLLDLAETKRSRAERTRIIVAGLVDMLVAQREAIAIMQANPSIRVQPGTDTSAYEGMRERAGTVLHGEHPTPDQRAALYINLAVAIAVPTLADLPADVLRETLTRTCTRLFKTR